MGVHCVGAAQFLHPFTCCGALGWFPFVTVDSQDGRTGVSLPWVFACAPTGSGAGSNLSRALDSIAFLNRGLSAGHADYSMMGQGEQAEPSYEGTKRRLNMG